MQGNKSVWGFFFYREKRELFFSRTSKGEGKGMQRQCIEGGGGGGRDRRRKSWEQDPKGAAAVPACRESPGPNNEAKPACRCLCLLLLLCVLLEPCARCCACPCTPRTRASRVDPLPLPPPLCHVPPVSSCLWALLSLAPHVPSSAAMPGCGHGDAARAVALVAADLLSASRPLGFARSHGPNMRASSRAQCVRTCGVRGRGCSAATPPPAAVGTCARIYGESNGRRRPARRPPRHATATRTRTTTPPATVTTTTAAAACRCFSRAVRAAPRAGKSDAMPMRDALHCT